MPITRLLPSYAGPLMMEEINALRSVLDKPKRPVAAVIGGAKVSTKIPVLTNLAAKVDKLIIGGGMANTFLLAQGVEIGKSLAEPDFAETAREIMHAAKARQLRDRACRTMWWSRPKFEAGAPSRVCPVLETPAGSDDPGCGAEVGRALHRRARAAATRCCGTARSAPSRSTPFGEGTFALARAAAAATQAGKLISVAGGGDTVAALNAAGVTEQFSYVSTAGGAFLEWLEGRELPGIAALLRRAR